MSSSLRGEPWQKHTAPRPSTSIVTVVGNSGQPRSALLRGRAGGTHSLGLAVTVPTHPDQRGGNRIQHRGASRPAAAPPPRLRPPRSCRHPTQLRPRAPPPAPERCHECHKSAATLTGDTIPPMPRLPEGEHVCLDPRSAEGDPEGAIDDLSRLAHKPVEPRLYQGAVALAVDVETVRRTWHLAVQDHTEGDLVPSRDRITRFTSRAWKRNAIPPPASLSTLARSSIVHSPASAHRFRGNSSGSS